MREATKWDLRFLRMAELVASWSKDPSTKTGSVIARPKRPVSMGFNGFPQGMNDAEELYWNREEKYSRIIHAEVNALTFSEENVQGMTIYVWPLAPCDRCAVQIIQAGIKRVVFPQASPDLLSRWGAMIERAKAYFTEADVEWVEVPLPVMDLGRHS